MLLQDEINPVMSALLGNRLEVTALVIMNEGKIEQSCFILMHIMIISKALQ